MSTISVDYDVLNQRGSPAWFTDTFANIPTAGFKGRMFISTDTFAFYRDTGTGWDLIGGPGIGTLTGSGVTGQVSFFNGTQVLAGNNNLFWDSTNSRLGINTTTPGQPLDIHSTGNTLVQLNNTSTGDTRISFQNQDVAKWRIGNEYGAGANIFSIYNVNTTSTPFQISNTTNQITINGALDLGNNTLTTGTTFLNNGIKYKDNIVPSSLNTGYVSTWFNINGTKNSLGLASSVTSPVYYAYDFPNASGTIALTSDLSSYVPYTGATGGVNLGAFGITLAGISNLAGMAMSQSGTTVPSAGYTAISGKAGGLDIRVGPSLIFSLLFPNTTGFDYTFPATTGTLALTSNLTSYLPLTGGTLTGNLTINPTNTGVIGLDVASNTTIIRSDNLEGFKRQLEITMGSGTLVQLVAKGYGANYGTDLAFYTATTGGTNASPGIYITGTNNRVGIKTGLPAYDLDVAGTFGVSGLLTATGFGANSFSAGGTGNNKLTLRNTTAGAANGAQLSVGTDADPDQFYIGSFSTTYTTSGMNVAGGAVVNGEGPGGLNLAATQSSIGFYTNGAGSSNLRMKIDSTGVVQVGNAVAATNVNLDINGVANKAGRIRFLESGAAQWLLGNGAASENGRFEVYDNGGGTGVQLLRGATAWIPLTSDVRLKKNFETTQGLNEILQIEPIKYNLLSEDDSTTKKLGFKAQNLQTLIPEMVVTNGRKADDGSDYLTIVPDYILPVLVKAIQELNEKLVKNNIN